METTKLERTFTVEGNIESVDDIMIGIPGTLRDEFVGATFESYKALSLCLAHADVVHAAKNKYGGRYAWMCEGALKAMREYLKK